MKNSQNNDPVKKEFRHNLGEEYQNLHEMSHTSALMMPRNYDYNYQQDSERRKKEMLREF